MDNLLFIFLFPNPPAKNQGAADRSNLPSTASESDQLPREEEYIPSTVCSTNLKKKGLPVESLEKETSVSSPKKHKSSHIPPCSMSSDRHQVHHPITQKDDFESYNYLVNLESDMASCKNQKKKGVSINPDSAKTGVSNSCDNNQPSTPRCTMSPDRHQVDHSITQKDDFESYNYQVNLKSDIVSCKNQKKKGVSSNPDSAKIGVSNSCDNNQPSTPRHAIPSSLASQNI
ncbi:uncharacterized protein [Bemisia tabaci]|uniref:uncharacterized protein isoform X2 n=1 Tax=Bemisia tabaci TaxID=7038 RepID=UPI003B28585E